MHPSVHQARDFYAALIVLFASRCARSVRVKFARENTESANGTGLANDPAVAPNSIKAGTFALGVGGVVGVLSQAPSHSTHVKSAIMVNGVYMQFPSWWVGSSKKSVVDVSCIMLIARAHIALPGPGLLP